MTILDRFIDWTLKFEPRDIWIGVYWTVRQPLTEYDRGNGKYIRFRVLIIYLCIVPMLPIKIRIAL